MIAVKIGTNSWRQATNLDVDEVEYVGEIVSSPDGFTSRMVWDAGLNNMRPMTQGEIDALPAQAVAGARMSASAMLSRSISSNVEVAALRAFVLTALDEFNLHAAKINAILTAIDNGTTLAQVRTNIAAIADYPTRTKANLITAMTNKINAGDADS